MLTNMEFFLFVEFVVNCGNSSCIRTHGYD